MHCSDIYIGFGIFYLYFHIPNVFFSVHESLGRSGDYWFVINEHLTILQYCIYWNFLLLLGIGADDAFIFLKMWQCNCQRQRPSRNDKSSSNNMELKKCLRKSPSDNNLKTENNSSLLSLDSLMAMTVHHAALSMFVTSVTTAGAFFASYTSHITAIKCFG